MRKKVLTYLIPFIQRCKWDIRLVTKKKRALPNFLIIGTQKGGTSSLYKNLWKHPQVEPSFHKEPHFYDFNYSKDLDWYRAFFPIKKKLGDRITGEATPYYLYHPDVPKRVYETQPNVKLIILLRNPVNRAFSHYNKDSLRGKDPLPFKEAVKAEDSRLIEERENNPNDHYTRLYHWKFSYLSRGKYAEQLKRWFEYFPRKQILIIQSEKYYSDSVSVFQEVEDFLGISHWTPSEITKYNVGRYIELDENLREELSEYFKPYNEELYTLLGERYDW